MNGSEDNPYRSPTDAPQPRGLPWSAPTVDTAHSIYMAGDFTWADCRRACRLMLRGSLVVRGWLLVVALLSIPIAVQLCVDRRAVATPHWGLAIVYAVLLGLVPLGVAWLRYAVARQTWRNVKDTPVRRWISETAIRTDTPKISTIEVWSVYGRHIISDELVLLSGRPSSGYLMFPRSHCLSDGDWGAFVALVESKTRRA
jgi:hypothetical protein